MKRQSYSGKAYHRYCCSDKDMAFALVKSLASLIILTFLGLCPGKILASNRPTQDGPIQLGRVESLPGTGSVVAWGDSSYGQTKVPAGLMGVVRVAGGRYHSLALKSDGSVVAWGAGTNNSRIGFNYGQSMPPTGLTDAVAIAAGDFHSLALNADGTVVAWGAGTTNSDIAPDYGQSMVPADLVDVVAIAAGGNLSLALTKTGQIVAWGRSRNGVPVVPAEATNVIAIAASQFDGLALKSDGTVLTWGSISRVQSFPNTVAITTSYALRREGWVINISGAANPPVGLSNAVQIAIVNYDGVALRKDGTVIVWGPASTSANRPPPGLTNVMDIGTGNNHSLAVLGDGSAVIKVPPTDQAVYMGQAATFNVMAAGMLPLRFQWQLNGLDLPSATNASLKIAHVTAPDGGDYRVVVSSRIGPATSRTARLKVLVPIAEALDAPALKWSFSGSAAWQGQIITTHDGVAAAQSGLIADKQSSTVQTTVDGPGILSFWWKVSSEDGFDSLVFLIDKIKRTMITGEMDWRSEVLAIPAGSHLLQWTYEKDANTSAGLDAGWLDQVTFVPDQPLITLQPLGQTMAMGETVNLIVLAIGAPPLSYQWLKNQTNLPGATSNSLILPKATRHDSGVYAVIVSNANSSSVSSNAILLVRSPQKLAIPAVLPTGGLRLSAADADGSLLWSGDLTGMVVQASVNLRTWVTLNQALLITNGFVFITDPQATNFDRRYYRMLER